MLLLSGLSMVNATALAGAWLLGWSGPGQEVLLAMDVAIGLCAYQKINNANLAQRL